MQFESSLKLSSSSQSMTTPLRTNVSSKLSSNNHAVQLIMREIVSCHSKTHVICGPRGVGKTWTANIVVQFPLCKTNFSDGVIWLGLGCYKSLNYTLLRNIYQQICAQLRLSIEPCLDEVIYTGCNSPDLSENEKKRERKAMMDARNVMSKFIAPKHALLCVDGLFDKEDIQYFQFHEESDTKKINFRLMVTINDDLVEVSNAKVWNLTNYHVDEAKSFFLSFLNPSTTKEPDFLEKYGEIFRPCHGNALSIKTLCHLVDDKIESKNYASLDSFMNKFENVPVEPKFQIYNILEAAFTNSSLGPSFNKITWRCFAAFAAVFKREQCLRPCIARSPVRALFSAVIKRVGKSSHSKASELDKSADRVIDFMVKMKILTEIDGYEGGKVPCTYYQISSDIYQEFGEQLSSSPQTYLKLHQLLINEYTTMFTNSHAAFGSNEIDHFMLKWLPYHLRESGEIEDQALTLPDYRFIEERVRFMGIVEAVKKHVDDAEHFVRMSTDGSDILLPSYEAVTRVLESQIDDKENIEGAGIINRAQNAKEINEIIEAMWCMAVSLFSHYYVKEGCQLIQKAKGYHDEIDSISSIDDELFQTLADSSPGVDHLTTVRSLIKIGSAIAKSSRRQYAPNIILLGLKGLIHCLGSENIEVARAHVFVGEVFFSDLKLFDDAINQFRLSLPLLLKELGEESEEVFDAIILCGKTYVHLGMLDTALEILEKICPNLQGPTEIDVRIKIASIYLIKGDPKLANSILVKARRKTSNKDLLKRIDRMRGECMDSQRYTI